MRLNSIKSGHFSNFSRRMSLQIPNDLVDPLPFREVEGPLYASVPQSSQKSVSKPGLA